MYLNTFKNILMMTRKVSKMSDYAVIKVNLPWDQLEYAKGNGEGIWVAVDKKTHDAYIQDYYGLVCKGRLRNNSIYYKSLVYDSEITFVLRGTDRPVAVWANFLSKIPRITPEEQNEVFAKILENQRKDGPHEH